MRIDQAVKDQLGPKARGGRQGKIEMVEAIEGDLRATFDLLKEIEELAAFIEIPNLAGGHRIPDFLGLWRNPFFSFFLFSFWNAGIEDHAQKLAPLEPLHLEQKVSFVGTTDAVNDLMVRYNTNVGFLFLSLSMSSLDSFSRLVNQVQTLSELFLYWDQVLTKLEIQVNRKYNDKFN